MKELKVANARFAAAALEGPSVLGSLLTGIAESESFDTSRHIALYRRDDHWLLRQEEE